MAGDRNPPVSSCGSPEEFDRQPRCGLPINDAQHRALFAALTQLIRDFATLASCSEPLMLRELDLRLAQGWILNFQFSVGCAGPLGCQLAVANFDGQTYEIVNIDAPPSDVGFRFVIDADRT